MEQRRFLLEYLSLVRFEGECFKEMGLGRGGDHRRPSRGAVIERGASIPVLLVIGVPCSAEERKVEEQGQDEYTF
jgi:hypothetical protein